jgi:hypothetical protein
MPSLGNNEIENPKDYEMTRWYCGIAGLHFNLPHIIIRKNNDSEWGIHFFGKMITIKNGRYAIHSSVENAEKFFTSKLLAFIDNELCEKEFILETYGSGFLLRIKHVQHKKEMFVSKLKIMVELLKDASIQFSNTIK